MRIKGRSELTIVEYSLDDGRTWQQYTTTHCEPEVVMSAFVAPFLASWRVRNEGDTEDHGRWKVVAVVNRSALKFTEGKSDGQILREIGKDIHDELHAKGKE